MVTKENPGQLYCEFGKVLAALPWRFVNCVLSKAGIHSTILIAYYTIIASTSEEVNQPTSHRSASYPASQAVSRVSQPDNRCPMSFVFVCSAFYSLVHSCTHPQNHRLKIVYSIYILDIMETREYGEGK